VISNSVVPVVRAAKKEDQMKGAWMLMVVALTAALLAAPVQAAQTKWVRGPVTAMGADTLTVTVKGVEHVFKVEPSTKLIARGAGTAAREAAEKGKAGPRLGDFVKVGQNVEVTYKEEGGAKVATEVRPVATAAEAASEEHIASGSSLGGTVVAVAADSITVKGDGKEMKFAVTPKTKVTGTGASTKTRELKAANKPTVLPEFVKANDQVIVYYTEEGGTATASGVRVMQKALK
jgi:hypothetical protein